jgi:hypothetical protein
MKSKSIRLGKFELLLEELERSNWSDPESYAKKEGFGDGWRFISLEEFRYIIEIRKMGILPEGLILNYAPYWTNLHLYISDLDDSKYDSIKNEIEEYIEGELEGDQNIKIYDWTSVIKICYLATYNDRVGSNYLFDSYDEIEEKGHTSHIYPAAGYLLVRDIK